MTSNKPRRSHYIPKMLLRNFCDHNGSLWIGDKCQRKLYQTSPEKAFVEKNLTMMRSFPDLDENYECEEILSKIESEAAPAISVLIEQARRNCILGLTPELNDHLKRFIVAQARRTPESQRQMLPDAEADKAFNVAAATLFRQNGIEVPEEDWFDQNPDVLSLKEKVRLNRAADFAAGKHPLVKAQTERFCREMGWGVAVICMPGRSFVIGSHGLTIVERPGSTYGSWLPIAQDVAIQLTAFPDKRFLLRLDRGNEWIIKTVNRSTAGGSRVIAGRSEELIRSLMRGYWRRVQSCPV